MRRWIGFGIIASGYSWVRNNFRALDGLEMFKSKGRPRIDFRKKK